MVLNAVQSGGTNLSFLRPESNEEEEGRNGRRRSTSPTRDGESNPTMQQQLPQRSPFGIQQLLGLSGNGSPSISRSNQDRFKNSGQNDLLPPATFTMSHHHHQLFPGSMMSHPSLTNSSLSGNCLTNHSITSGQSSPHQHQGQSSHQVSNVPSSSSSSSSSPSAPSPSFSAPPTSSSFSQAAAAAADSAARLAYLTSSPAAAALMSASMASMSAAAHHHHQIHHPGGHHPGTMSMFHPAFTSSPSASVDPMTGVPHGKI